MADCAYLVVNGEIVKKCNAHNLTEADRQKTFKCCGKGCNAKLVPRIGPVRQYFTEDPRSEPHIQGCDYDESSGNVRYKKVRTLARFVDEFSFDCLFANVINPTPPATPPGPRSTGPREGGPDGGGGDDNPDIITMEEPRPPRSLSEIILLFTEYDFEFYGSIAVKDILVDSRSISQYRPVRE